MLAVRAGRPNAFRLVAPICRTAWPARQTDDGDGAKEITHWQDFANGADVLLRAVLEMDRVG